MKRVHTPAAPVASVACVAFIAARGRFSWSTPASGHR